MAAAIRTKTVDVAALASRAPAAKRYAIDSKAHRAPLTDGTSVVTGALAAGKLAGEASLVWENGTAQSALPLAVVLVAIRDGVIPRETVQAFLDINA